MKILLKKEKLLANGNCFFPTVFHKLCTTLIKEHDSLVVLGFNATLTAKVISRQSKTHMCFLAF